MARLCVIGMLTHDTIWRPRTPFQPHQTLVVVAELIECLGGKGFVAAVAAVRCGLQAQLIAYTSPEVLTGTWDLKSVDVSSALCVQEVPSRTWTVLRDGQDVLTIAHEAPTTTISPDLVAEVTMSGLAAANGLYLTTESTEVVAPTLEILADRRPNLVAVNLNAATMGDKRFTDQLIREHLNVADLLIANESEERQILDRVHLNGWSDMASSPLGASLNHIVITLGAQGCRWSQRPFRRWYHSPAHTTGPVRCALGAGDTFAGVLTGQMVLTGNLRGALHEAQRAAAVKISTVSSSL